MKDRLSLRKVADSPLRIQIEPNNDAIVLNVSDGGLSFRALRPVTQSGTVHFSYLDNGQRMNARGELVWTDSTRLTGGLSFASLPRMNWEQFQNWVEQSSQESTLPTTESPPRNAAPGSDGPGTLPNFSPLQSAMPGFALPVDEQPARFSWDPALHRQTSGSSFFPGFVTGVILTAIALIVLFFFYGNFADALREQVRQSAGFSPTPQIAPAATPVSPSPPPVAALPPVAPSPPNASLPPSDSTSASPSSAPPSAASPDLGDNSAANAAVPPAAAQPPQATNQSPNSSSNPPHKAAAPGEDDLSLAQRYLTDMPGPEGRVKATQYLWSAVEKGNLKAEISLADLYARGDGVKKNCAQARVLLRAAAEKGSAEASNALARLIRSGCS